MKAAKGAILLAMIGTSSVACDDLAGALPPPGDPLAPDGGVAPPDPPVVPDVPEDPVAALEDAIFDALQCEEIARPSTLQRIRDLLHDPTAEELQALLTAPEDIATIVAMGGLKVEGSVVLARNLARVLSGEPVVQGGWDGVECGSVALACTAGEKTSTVLCEQGVPVSVDVAFEGCVLDGTLYDGALAYDRVDGDPGAARVAFSSFTIDEVKRADGALEVRVGLEDGVSASAGGDSAFVIESHGGPTSGLSCGEALTIDALALDADLSGGVLQLDGRNVTDDGSFGIRTTGEHLAFETPAACGCPIVGSAVELELPRPLGRAGEEALLRVEWKASADAALCAQAQVTAVQWPGDCAGIDEASRDCGRAATEQTLSELLTAFCVLQ